MWEAFHVAYVNEPIPDHWAPEPGVPELARRFGLPADEADERATHGHWWLERQAQHVREWQRQFGRFARRVRGA